MELVFFDLETTIPATDIIEFGAIVLDKDGLYEKESYSTLIWSDKITDQSVECNGITREMLKDAPKLAEVADSIYNILNGRIWAGHNIINFDIPRINESFKRIVRTEPRPSAIIDTLPLLRSSFGRRAGSLGLASLGNYFGLGQERHRSLEDVRMNIEILKNCSMIMFLEENAGYSSSDLPKEQPVSAKEVPFLKDLKDSMAGQQDIWISYDGGTNPLVPRRIKPLRWVSEPLLIEAYCHQSQTNKNFAIRKIVDIRNQEWQVERQ